jgi:hypothetical protein
MVENVMFISEIVMTLVRSSSLGLFVSRSYLYINSSSGMT